MSGKGLPMKSGVVIDQNIIHMPETLEYDVKEHYKTICRVSKDEDLPQRIKDEDIGSYCKRKGYDLITCDKGAHVEFFNAGIQMVQVERIWCSRNGPHIYRFRVIE